MKFYFIDIQPRSKDFKTYMPLIREQIRRLQVMRFRLINDVSSVQHYVLGHLFSTVKKVFDKNLEESYDLESLIDAHNYFVDSMYGFCQKLRDNEKESYGFAKVI